MGHYLSEMILKPVILSLSKDQFRLSFVIMN